MARLRRPRNTIPVSQEPTHQVSLGEIADELQTSRQTIHRIVKRLGLHTEKRRDEDRGNQLVTSVSTEDVPTIRGTLEQGRRTTSNAAVGSTFDGEIGFFYIIQLEPDHDEHRFKVGFTTDLQGRLTKHRCSAPFAVCLRSWPCRRTWERAAIDSVTEDSEQLHTEVFRALDLQKVIERCEGFFGVMPRLEDPEDFDDNETDEGEQDVDPNA